MGSKPLIIAEMGIYKMPSEDSKAQWVEDASSVLQSGEFPRIKGIVWWGVKLGGDYDGYPDTSSTFLDGFKQAFDQPFFVARTQFSGDCSPLPPSRVRESGRRLSWSAVPNAASYEVWRGSKKIAAVAATSLNVATPGAYRVRSVNVVGYSPFVAATRPS